MQYHIIITKADGTFGGYLSHRNRTEWAFKTAIRYAEEFVKRHGGRAKVVEV